MRDLRRYPITLREIQEALEREATKLSKEESVGDVRPLLFSTAAKIIQRLEFTTHKIGLGL